MRRHIICDIPDELRTLRRMTQFPAQLSDWAEERERPRYILDLLLSVITVSVETVKIVNTLPSLDNLFS